MQSEEAVLFVSLKVAKGPTPATLPFLRGLVGGTGPPLPAWHVPGIR